MPKSKKRKGAHPHRDHNPQADTNKPWIAQPNSNGPIDHTQRAAITHGKDFKHRGGG